MAEGCGEERWRREMEERSRSREEAERAWELYTSKFPGLVWHKWDNTCALFDFLFGTSTSPEDYSSHSDSIGEKNMTIRSLYSLLYCTFFLLFFHWIIYSRIRPGTYASTCLYHSVLQFKPCLYDEVDRYPPDQLSISILQYRGMSPEGSA